MSRLFSYLPEFVYGSMDGLVTTFAIVAGAMGASLSPGIILIMGFANVLADAFSMGSSSYLAAQAETSLQEKNTLIIGVVTFVSFVLIGLIPLFPFLIAFFEPSFEGHATFISVVSTLFTFAVIGYVAGMLSERSPLYTALQHFFIGGIAALIAFGVGFVLRDVFGV